MKRIAKLAFHNATIVSDRFHVQKLMNVAIDMENAEIKLVKELGRKHISHTFANGDIRRQLLARSGHIVIKNRSKWTLSQQLRTRILFEQCPDIEEA